MFRFASSMVLAALVLFAGLIPQAHATVPGYFFSEWRINRACAEVGTTNNHPAAGLRFRITAASVLPDGKYPLQIIDAEGQVWPSNWQGVKLAHRSGTPLSSIPADFDCNPGFEASHPILASSGYTQATEPYYPYEHWYGTVTIGGYKHHVLLFPRNTQGASSGAVLLINSGQLLSNNGTIVVEN